MAKVIAFLVLLIVSPAAYAATTFTVGDTSGWTTGFNYATWAGSKTFTAGDTLLFNYGPSHTVDEVTQADYLNCNTANPISSDSNSPTSISLPAADTRYFICVTSNHCSRGQKLAVTVTAGGAAPSPPTGTPSTPATPGTPTTPATPATPTTPATPGTPVTPRTPSTPAPPPPSGDATATLGGRSGLVGGLSLVLVAVFGLMG